MTALREALALLVPWLQVASHRSGTRETAIIVFSNRLPLIMSMIIDNYLTVER